MYLIACCVWFCFDAPLNTISNNGAALGRTHHRSNYGGGVSCDAGQVPTKMRKGIAPELLDISISIDRSHRRGFPLESAETKMRYRGRRASFCILTIIPFAPEDLCRLIDSE